jgi:hypothetical protein
VLRRLRNSSVRVGGRSVALDSSTITCTGIGRPVRNEGGEPAWNRFRCVQPTFPEGRVAGPDAILVIEPTGPRSFAVTGRRLAGY